MRLNNFIRKKNGLGYPIKRYPIHHILLLITITSIVCYLIIPVQVLNLSINNANLINIIIDEDIEFYIDYTHSVEKTNVRDVFVIKNNNVLVLTRSEYCSFGAGLPTESYGDLKLVDGVYINDGINKELTNIPLRIGHIANHKLVLQDGNELVLSDFVVAGSLVDITPKKITNLQTILIKRRIQNEQ